MPDKAQITFAVSALTDLKDLRSYYAKEGAPEAGEKIIAGIFVRVERLGAHPQSGRVVPEFDVEHLREIVYTPFRIVYRHDRNKVRIVRIWRSERLLKLP